MSDEKTSSFSLSESSPKESAGIAMMELDGKGVIGHDDILVIRFQKHRLGLEEEYWRALEPVRYESGQPVILSYWKPNAKEGEKRNAETLEEIPERERGLWKPVIKRRLVLDDRERYDCISFPSYLELGIRDLWRDLASRYTKALDAIVEAMERGVIKYRPRVASPTEKHIREAIRHKLKGSASIARYEHDILFQGELGQRIYEDLEAKHGARYEEGGTIYIQGHAEHTGRRGTKAKLKYYPIQKREGIEGLRVWKLETTFLNPYFRSAGIGIEDLRTQDKIQALLLIDLEKYVTKALRDMGEDTMRAIQLELGVEKREEAPRALLKRELTLTARVHDLERRVGALEEWKREREGRERERGK